MSGAPAPQTPTARQWPRRWAVPPWGRPLVAAVVGFVVMIILRTGPYPAPRGQGLVVLLGMIGVMASGGVLLLSGLRGRRLPGALEIVLYAVLMIGSILLVWIEPDGIGFFGGFVIAGVASSRMPGRLGVAVTAAFLVALGVASVVGGQRAVLPTMASEFGAIAFYRLGLYARRLKARTEESERLLSELERTREAQLRAAALGERQRLAREMHDVLAHSLAGLSLHLEGARLLAVRNAADAKLTDTIERAHRLAQAGLSEARQAIGMLRDDDLPGPERLPTLAEEFERDTGVPCGLISSGRPVELDAQTRLTLYRVAQEALTNIRKHATPQRVELRLDYRPDGTRLTVLDVAARPTRSASPLDDHGYGVTGMRERAELLGGTLSAGPNASGFEVALWVPAGRSQ